MEAKKAAGESVSLSDMKKAYSAAGSIKKYAEVLGRQ
jgi:hypothetical protein